MSKVIVITGAGGGLGRALARRFVNDGEKVVLLGRTASKVEAVAQELGSSALAIGCDVGSPDSVRDAFEIVAKTHPRIDVLINNAAVIDQFKIEKATDEQILGMVTTNLAGPMLCTRSAVPLMGRGSHLINVSSESVDMVFPMLTAYQSTKAGVERLTKSLYKELEPKGIRVSVVRAGEMIGETMSFAMDPGIMRQFFEETTQAGLNLAASPKSDYQSVTNVFRTLIDLPEDLQVDLLSVHGRAKE